ncbi:MAG: hypothetical protein KJ880_02450, partial [Candidatus Omnitrophica bacterium]|nr:hypothetical protein [Candidatus Omnitrophota bacterium]
MNIRDIPLFCCLSCKQDLSLSIFQEGPKGEEKVETGVLFCPTCKLFYPISEGVIFLLDRGYYKGFDLETFLEKWSDKFDFNNFKVL